VSSTKAAPPWPRQRAAGRPRYTAEAVWLDDAQRREPSRGPPGNWAAAVVLQRRRARLWGVSHRWSWPPAPRSGQRTESPRSPQLHARARRPRATPYRRLRESRRVTPSEKSLAAVEQSWSVTKESREETTVAEAQQRSKRCSRDSDHKRVEL